MADVPVVVGDPEALDEAERTGEEVDRRCAVFVAEERDDRRSGVVLLVSHVLHPASC